LREEGKAKANTFTAKHYPVNDLLALDLQDHLVSVAESGWVLIDIHDNIQRRGDYVKDRE